MSCDELLLNRCHPKNTRNSKWVDIINLIDTIGIVSFPLLTEYADGYQQNRFFFRWSFSWPFSSSFINNEYVSTFVADYATISYIDVDQN